MKNRILSMSLSFKWTTRKFKIPYITVKPISLNQGIARHKFVVGSKCCKISWSNTFLAAIMTLYYYLFIISIVSFSSAQI
ncbi:hypothetical protein BpHYR1_035121 [Brachionus plicatilis]|uniref:Uncharacterized protein n=1 Tax=Brachionus plicatilis TaxID=10195 RepID=A0A3M7RJB7_BRAPC|nr:hypothetical protein BpHYR1_035121 [Brachionus plicatilis]